MIYGAKICSTSGSGSSDYGSNDYWLHLLWTLHPGLIWPNLDLILCSGVQQHWNPLRRWYGLGGMLARQLLHQPGISPSSSYIAYALLHWTTEWMAFFQWITGKKDAIVFFWHMLPHRIHLKNNDDLEGERVGRLPRSVLSELQLGDWGLVGAKNSWK